jgi:hypothetical protein
MHDSATAIVARLSVNCARIGYACARRLTITGIAHVIQLAVAPVFLLSG